MTEIIPNASDRISRFPETRWSVVLKAQGRDGPATLKALGELCQSYWYPLYAFVRSRGHSPEEAEDRTQGFFQQLLASESLLSVSADRGRLRAFLLAAMKKHLVTGYRRDAAQKRGGGALQISMDRAWAEGSLAAEMGAADSCAPEDSFDQNWAFALLATVSRRLEEFYNGIGKREMYDALKGCLEGDGDYGSSVALGAQLGMSPEGVRSAVFKLRARFREYVEAEVADTCENPEDARDEISHLCRILAR